VASEWPKDGTAPIPSTAATTSRAPFTSGARVTTFTTLSNFPVSSRNALREGERMYRGSIAPARLGETKGPLRWAPRTTRSRLRYSPTSSRNARITSKGAATAVGRSPVVPCWTWKWMATSKASSVFSMNPLPPPPFTWVSMKPGLI